MNVYAAYLLDKEELLKSSSGGVAFALSERFIYNGGVVVGAAYTKDFSGAEYIIASDTQALKRIRGTKYIWARKEKIYQDIEKLLHQKVNVLFIGLPCDVAGLKAFLHKEHEELYCVDLVCHGATYPDVQKEYTNFLKRKYRSEIKDFNVRYKKENWVQPYIHVEFENGKKFEKQFYDSEYGYIFSRLCREGCFKCKFRGGGKADLTIGDFWGTQKDDPWYNEAGVSVVLTHSLKGENLFVENEKLQIFRTDLEKAVACNSNILYQKRKSKNYDSLKKDFFEHGLFVAVKRNQSIKDVIRKIIKKAIPRKILLKWKWG